jgi:hypothetical protein
MIQDDRSFRQVKVYGLEGVGALTRGGADALTVYTVTNTNDSGAGSLRAAAEASGARFIQFAVSGTINLASDLTISNGSVWIDGSSAPNGGICLRYGTLKIENASQVILRHLRIRPGLAGTETQAQIDSRDCLTIEDSTDVIVDHCSLSWSTDEALNISRSNRVTVQRCLIAEPLDDAGHTSGTHAYACLVKGQSGQVDLHHNVFAAFRARGLCTSQVYGSPGLQIVARNNVWYHGYSTYCHGYADDEPTELVLINNYLRIGPHVANAGTQLTPFLVPYNQRWYVSGNTLADASNATGGTTAGVCADNWAGVHFYAGEWVSGAPSTSATKVAAVGLPAIPQMGGVAITTQTAAQAYASLVTGGEVGATLPKQDATDARIIANVANGTHTAGSNTSTGLVSDPTAGSLGGWPDLTI